MLKTTNKFLSIIQFILPLLLFGGTILLIAVLDDTALQSLIPDLNSALFLVVFLVYGSIVALVCTIMNIITFVKTLKKPDAKSTLIITYISIALNSLLFASLLFFNTTPFIIAAICLLVFEAAYLTSAVIIQTSFKDEADQI